MLNNCAENKNPLVLGGTSQLDRYLAQLKPDYIKVDEKSLTEWVTFCSKMSEQLTYYNIQNYADGNWSSFFSSYALVNYAKISLEDVNAIQQFFQGQLAILEDETAPADQMVDAFTTLCDCVFTICVFIDQQLAAADVTSGYYTRISGLITNKLKTPLKSLIAFYRGALGENYAPNSNYPPNYPSNVPVYNNHYLVNDSLIPSPVFQIFGKSLIGRSQLFLSLSSPLWYTFPGVQPAYTSIQEMDGRTTADTGIFAQTSVNLPTGPSDTADIQKCLNRASTHPLFTGILDTFLYACSYLKQTALQSFDLELKSDNDIQPHLALYLTFLHLLKEAQTDLNQFTSNHLDFFYKQVLQLAPLASQPNQVHITAQISKQLDEYLLPAQTLFKAGKDDTGKDIYYALTEDTIFNQAQISSLRSFYQAGAGDNGVTSNGAQVINDSKAFASLVANSSDGLGAAITDTPPSWQAFGNKAVSNSGNVTMLMPTARIGFALSSQYLFLAEGQRSITVKLYMNGSDYNTLYNVNNNSKIYFTCDLTTAKAWTAVPGTLNPSFSSDSSGYYIEFDIKLDVKFAPVVGYSANVHGAGMSDDTPVIRFTLDDDDFNAAGCFAQIRYTQFTRCTITVSVGNWCSNANGINAGSFTGIKNLYLSNDFGVLDSTQPFDPFGTPAQANRSFIIGSRELFLKAGASYQIIAEYTGLGPEAYGIPFYITPSEDIIAEKGDFMVKVQQWAPKIAVQYLEGGTWGNTSATSAYDTTQFSFLENTNLPGGVYVDFDEAYGPYTQSTTDGFLRINLVQDFGYAQYQSDLLQFKINQSRNGGSLTDGAPVEPYNPSIKGICINYTATADLIFGQNTPTGKFVSYYHLYPFGVKELTNNIPTSTALLLGRPFRLANISRFQPMMAFGGIRSIRLRWGNPIPISIMRFQFGGGVDQPIFPQFSARINNSTLNFMSEFYLGLQNISPGENVNILFQVLDGSTNPLIAKPVPQVYWFYLSDNEWIAFNNTQIRDNTFQLIQSGIIGISIPSDADTKGGQLPAGTIWIKASITEEPDAVCKLISVLPQAALLQLTDNNNSADLMQSQLPAKTISKLLKPISVFKQIVQPFATFGGKMAESIDAFRVRVSERIRHKNRAIQIWDYERLILQQFSTLQKVKCINHTCLEPGIMYNEQAPGHVTIIAIPYINTSNSVAALKPYTSISQLNAIQQYISPLMSPHVKLHVGNPLFEEIKLSFRVQFIEGADLTYCTNQLINEIVGFLAPWYSKDNADISFGGTIYKSTLIGFIEGRSYVTYITDMVMQTMPDGASTWSADADSVTASTARSILVSAPAESYSVNPITTN